MLVARKGIHARRNDEVPKANASQNERPAKQSACTSLSAFQKVGMCSTRSRLERCQLTETINNAGRNLKIPAILTFTFFMPIFYENQKKQKRREKMIAVVGIGPGNLEQMTNEAEAAISNADLVVGYGKYVELVRRHFPQKNFFETGMMKEKERCLHALKEAESKNVALVCSGDSCVYGMASLVMELAEGFPQVEIEIIPGVTAALSGGAILGSPLTADFLVLSLSDHLMPKEKIEKRLRASSLGDLSVAIYNPMSRTRPDALKNACKILLEDRDGGTVCGYVRNIGRENTEYGICTLAEMQNAKLDMFCTVFIGNSETKTIEINGRKYMLNPRGYKID